MNNFLRALKSTVDKILNDVAVAASVPYVDIDDKSRVRVLSDSNQKAVLGHFQTFPKTDDRTYKGCFGVGVKVSTDPGNYAILALLDTLSASFRVGKQFPVRDWSGVTVGPVLGRIVITSTSLQPNEDLGDSNVRFIQVEASAVQFV